MANKYDFKKLNQLISLAKKCAPYHGILDCRRLLFLSEYFIAKTGTEKSIVGLIFDKDNKNITLETFLNAFNSSMFNGISLGYTINKDKKTLLSFCDKKPVASSTAKLWVNKYNRWDGKEAKDEFFAEIDMITYYLLKKPFITEELADDIERSISEELYHNSGKDNYYCCKDYENKGWNAYVLSKYLKSKNNKHSFALETCRAALRRLYLIDSRTQLPAKSSAVYAKDIMDSISDENYVYDSLMNISRVHNVQDIIYAVSKGNLFNGKISILTWYPEPVRTHYKIEGSRLHYKYMSPGFTIQDNYFEFDVEESFNNAEYLWDSIINSIGMYNLKKTRILVMNRHDYLAPYVANHINNNKQKYRYICDSVILLDFSEEPVKRE